MSGGSDGRAMTVLNVAEKPSVAKSVSTLLSRNQGLRVREGRSRYNKVFEFGYCIRGQPCHMMMTSVIGHVTELEFDERFRKWNSCDPADLFHAPIRKSVPQDKMDIKRTLEEEARRSQWLVLWLDCDREGENIAFEVIEICTAANRHLTIKRARFSALIEREIHDAVQNLVQPNKLFSDAVDARQEIDLRIGASFTRFQTILLTNAFVIDSATGDRSRVLSYGPCQFPTLGFIVERYWEIQSHEPEEFWTINCSYRCDEGVASFNWTRGHLFDYTCAVILYEMCVEEPSATVTRVRQQEKHKYPPHPLNTIELEKRASRYFRMSSEQTMKVAEELYQAGFISYPRTETDNFSSRTNLLAIVQEQQGHPTWGPYAQRLLDPNSGLWRNPSNGGHDDKAHPPIHPTKYSGGESSWSQDHHRLYEIVVRHFLACVSQPAVGAETIVEIDIAGEQFNASGRVIIARNYLDVYRFESWGGSVIPTFISGQQFIPTTLTLDSGVTRPPPLLSEADLLNCMDKAGIGTDATMHDHIKKLLDRCYATKDQNTQFSPTNLGEALVMGYDDMGYKLWKPNLRAMMEMDMRAVSDGAKTKAEVLEACLQQMKACLLDVRDVETISLQLIARTRLRTQTDSPLILASWGGLRTMLMLLMCLYDRAKARMNKQKLMEAMALFFERSTRLERDEQHVIGGYVRVCGLCRDSNMLLKQNRDGNFFVGCQGYPQCRNVVWLPGSVSEAFVTTNVCNSCTPGPVYKIQFKFRQLEIPPNYDLEYLGCIGGCDYILRQLTEICGTGSRMAARGQAPTPHSSSAPRRNTTQLACIYCRQTGHSSSNCPSHIPSPKKSRSRQGSTENGESSSTCTTCGASCVLRTANTANNRGRKFYSCQSQGCNFFVWEDSLGTGSRVRTTPSNGNNSASLSGRASGTIGRGRGRGSQGTFVSAIGDPVTGRCFICGDPSHFANVCPNRNA